MADPYSRAYDYVLLDRVGTDGRVGRLTLNRPDRRNAISRDLLADVDHALHALEADFDTRVIILRGAGAGFCSGYDLAKVDYDTDRTTYRREDEQGRHLAMGIRTAIQEVVDVYLYFWNIAKVTIAQIHGFALAGGCELAMLADLVVASTDARLGHPATRMGVSRTGVTWPLIIGMRQAKELYYTGSTVSGARAESIGMINHAWPADELDTRTVEYADLVANLSSDHLAMLKQSMNRFYDNMGMYSSVRTSTDLDVMSKFTAQAYWTWDTMAETMRSGGTLRDVIDMRDAPYREYETRQRAAAEDEPSTAQRDR